VITLIHGPAELLRAEALAGLRAGLESVQEFFSDRRKVTYVAASVILTAAFLNFVSGWLEARFRRSNKQRYV